MASSSKTNSPKTIDEYLAALPVNVRTQLERLRKTIKSVVPEAEELISYGIPSFKYKYMLVGFAAFKNHCSFFVMSTATMKAFKEDLKTYETAPGTIRFTADKPLPLALVKKLVKARIDENEFKHSAKQTKAPAVKKSNTTKTSDLEKVNEYMHKLTHPLKAEIEAVRRIIKGVNSNIAERIKWNAPSYYYKEDFVTFNPRATNHVHLVFHHPFIVKIKSPLLEGDYKDRRMIYFKDMKSVKANKKELERIMQSLIIELNSAKN